MCQWTMVTCEAEACGLEPPQLLMWMVFLVSSCVECLWMSACRELLDQWTYVTDRP